MTFSTRVSIQWSDKNASENTSTIVSSSPKGHFVDIRIFSKEYPHIDRLQNNSISEVFDWCMTGIEVPLPNSNKIRFDHEIDSHAIAKSIETGRPVEDFESDPDVGDFSEIQNSLDRKETGEMLNSESGEVENYIEIWRSLDASNHTPDFEVRELPQTPQSKASVLIASSVEYEGKYIRLGNWAQGILYDKTHKSHPLKVLRAFFDTELNSWTKLIEYGSSDYFPLAFEGSEGDSAVAEGSTKWICIEV